MKVLTRRDSLKLGAATLAGGAVGISGTPVRAQEPTLDLKPEANATLRFVDITANNTELARALVKPRQIVRIDARRGVMLGETIIRPGPLPNDHQYGIWLEPETGDMMRDTTLRIAPQPDNAKPNSR